MGAVFSGKYEGIDPETGMYKFKLRPDAVTNKDGYLREPNNYYYYLGTSVAPFTGGFNLNFSYKNIGLSVGGSYSVKANLRLDMNCSVEVSWNLSRLPIMTCTEII